MRRDVGDLILKYGNNEAKYTVWGSIFKPDSSSTLGGIYVNIPIKQKYSDVAIIGTILRVRDLNVSTTDDNYTRRVMFRIKKFGKLDVGLLDSVLVQLGHIKIITDNYEIYYDIKKSFRTIYNEAVMDGL